MTAEPVRAAAWLALREPADAAARSLELVEILRRRLPDDAVEVHDLGSGTGSMARWLAPRLPEAQRWVLHDRDADLLELAAHSPPPQAADGAVVDVETRRDDITRLAATELAGASLVTASALLDMLTEEELGRFVGVCAAAGCPVLVTLSVVGRVELTPADPLDARVMEAFNAHQRRRARGGQLLGPRAAGVAAAAFERLGLEVHLRPSPWRLGAEHGELAVEWLRGWVGAACEQEPALAEVAGPYWARRRAEAVAGSAYVVVEHQDLLALPQLVTSRVLNRAHAASRNTTV